MNTTLGIKELSAWMQTRFMPARASGWESALHLHLERGAKMTIESCRRKLLISNGFEGEPLATVRTTSSTLMNILKGEEPLDLAIIKNTLKTDNVTETFKFITVFEPDKPHKTKKGGAE